MMLSSGTEHTSSVYLEKQKQMLNVHRRFTLEWARGSQDAVLHLHTIFENDKFFREAYTRVPLHMVGVDLLNRVLWNVIKNKKRFEEMSLNGKVEYRDEPFYEVPFC